MLEKIGLCVEWLNLCLSRKHVMGLEESCQSLLDSSKNDPRANTEEASTGQYDHQQEK